MSKTDKTNPYWVQIPRREGNRKPWRVYHMINCDGTCTPGTPLPGQTQFIHCEIWMRYSDNYLFYGRRPKRSTRKATGRSRRHRADLVRLRRKWLWQDREDIDSLENAPINHRYLYDPWDWD